MSEMTPRERVHAAAKGLPVDRVPVMYWFNPHMACRLMAEFQPSRSKMTQLQASWLWKNFRDKGGLKAPQLARFLPHMFNEYANGRYALELGADLVIEPVGAGGNVKRIYRAKGRIKVLDSYHSVRALGGIYMDVVEPAIKSVEDLKGYRFPDFSGEKHFDYIRKLRKEYPCASILMENFGVQDFFCTQIWSMTPFMTALCEYPDEVKAYQQRFADWAVDNAYRGVRAGADCVFIYDDYGYTDSTLISMKMWKEFTYPHLRRIIEAVHDAGALAVLHSCGYQAPFLDYYVEAELDILQAFQPKAGNDFRAACEKYGDRLAFATGIDVQQGELMTAGQMRESILESYRIGKKHGRHILGMTHMLQYTMPGENVRAIFDTVREIQLGLHA
jgi:uroporphyrinogen decarboxylase